MKRRSEQDAATLERGDTAQVRRLRGHRVAMLAGGSAPRSPGGSDGGSAASRGFTLIELVISITVMTILTLGVVPLVKVSVKRQREQQLHETLRAIRSAIDEFHRDTLGMNALCAQAAAGTGQPPFAPPTDPRSRVMISDCTIFGVDNADHYPPDLDTLIRGVNVIPRLPPNTGGRGLSGNPGTALTQSASTKTKVYLRGLPIDPITGKAEWDLRSCYDAADSDSWGGENVFDVRSKSRDTALNGEKYRDW